KTVAFGLALAHTLLGDKPRFEAAAMPLGLVVAPTRELAQQVAAELTWLYASARVVACVGGMDPRAERRALEQGCHIVVGTPGRLRDHLERGQLRLESLDAAVLDEADEMLDLGFREELEEILDATPAERRTLLFSATLPRPIVALAETYQTNALRLTVGGDEPAHGDIDYRAIRVAPSEVELATVNVLRFFEAGAAMIFCNTREGVRKLHANLVERGFSVEALSGELTQNARTQALQALRDRRARICVATDVAARGIDIPDLDLVIHADLPVNRETLQHRSGRTGRAGRKGVCVILVPHPKRRRADQLLKGARIEATWQAPPSAEDIRARDQARLIEAVQPAADAAEEDLAVARSLLAQRSAEDVAAAYVRLARSRMPAPEDLSESEPEPRGYGARETRGRDRYDRGGEAPPPEPPRPGFEDAVWFRIDLGRNKNAEARWILPMLCRRGHATKRDIGAIRVFDRETRFQVTAEAADRFEAAAAKGDADGGRIIRLDVGAPMPQDRPPPGARPPREGGKPYGKARVSDERAQPADREETRPRKPPFKKDWNAERGSASSESWSPSLEGAATEGARPKAPYKGKQPNPKPKKKRKPNG
ncbi:MAG: DEAD/DEAH box helicase, partial [Caulobacteraceae bacterium]|nr:DEAD/DEAH box helicase [Caulobacteraceae bacterium]